MDKIILKKNNNKKKESIDSSIDLEVANQIIKKFDLFYYNQLFYIYTGNYWKPIDHNKIRKEVLNILQDKYKQSRVNNIIDIIQLETLKESNEINLNSERKALNVQNGMYFIKDKKLISHNRENKELYSTNLFNIRYNKTAKCERWERFVNEIFEPDQDKENKIMLLQEYLGYCITQDVFLQKSLLLLGNGSNGKSIVIQVMEKILGNENYSNIELHQLNNKNYIVELQNKLVNFCSEIDHKSQFSSGIFKRIITGETLTGDAKFKHPIKFQPRCKLLFATNDLPKTSDTTKGYFRRLLILKFNRSFEGKEKDIYLIDNLNNELPGIFNWLLIGLDRLYKNNQFTIPMSSINEVNKYLESNNSVVSFINEKCEITNDPDQYEKYDFLYAEYRTYCNESGDKPFKKTNFKIEIEKQFQNKIIFKRIDKRGNHFQNVKIIKVW